MRRILALAAMVVACGPAEPAAEAPSAPRTRARAPVTECPAVVPVPDLLWRHRSAYGQVTRQAVFELEGASAKGEWVVTDRLFRESWQVGDLPAARGVDAAGAWEVRGGVLVRWELAEHDGNEARVRQWLLARAYASEGTSLTNATCVMEGGRPIAELSFANPTIGVPMLRFDLDSAALVEAKWSSFSGPIDWRFDGWSPPDAQGVRWPVRVRRPDGALIFELRRADACARPAGDCLASIPGNVALEWPAGTNEVELPLTVVDGLPTVPVTVGGRRAIAALDTGASPTAVGEGTEAAAGFEPSAIAGVAQGVVGGVEASLGYLRRVELGGMKIDRLLTQRVPLPAGLKDSFGPAMPQLFLGTSLFTSAVVRLDHARGKVVIARPGTRFPGSATEVRVQLDDMRLMVDTAIDGTKALLQIDTGSGSPLTLTREWAVAHNLPGGRPVMVTGGAMGFGKPARAASQRVHVRADRFDLVPISRTDPLVEIEALEGHAGHAGILGSPLLGACQAVTFDLRGRRLHLEPPCDRRVFERSNHYALARSPSDAFPKSPFVLARVVDRTPLARAGLAAGDRLLEINGRPAGEQTTFASALDGEPGARIPIVFARQNRRHQALMTVTPALPK